MTLIECQRYKILIIRVSLLLKELVELFYRDLFVIHLQSLDYNVQHLGIQHFLSNTVRFLLLFQHVGSKGGNLFVCGIVKAILGKLGPGKGFCLCQDLLFSYLKTVFLWPLCFSGAASEGRHGNDHIPFQALRGWFFHSLSAAIS